MLWQCAHRRDSRCFARNAGQANRGQRALNRDSAKGRRVWHPRHDLAPLLAVKWRQTGCHDKLMHSRRHMWRYNDVVAWGGQRLRACHHGDVAVGMIAARHQALIKASWAFAIHNQLELGRQAFRAVMRFNSVNRGLYIAAIKA